MSLNLVPAGRDLPNDFNVVIEIPMNADPIKYEVDKESGAIFVDRFMGTSMHYPCNYGYVPHTIADDGDPVDVLVITPFPLLPGVVVRCRPIGPVDSIVETHILEYHGEKRGDLYYTKDMLLAIGDKYEAEIAANRAADARYR